MNDDPNMAADHGKALVSANAISDNGGAKGVDVSDHDIVNLARAYIEMRKATEEGR